MSTPVPRQTPAPLAPRNAARDALRAILATCVDDFERHRAQMMISDDPLGPHGARVALRRLRTALTAFAPLLRRRPARAVAREARSIFRTLGRLRDADVVAQTHPRGAAGARLAAEASRIRTEVRAALAAAAAEGFGDRVRALAQGPRWCRRGARRLAKGPVEPVAAAALAAAWAAVCSHGKTVSAMGTEARHGFRKDLKSLRYLTDFFGPLWPGKRQARFLERLKLLQDALGVLNDLAVAEARLGATGRDARAQLAGSALSDAEREWRRLRRGRLWW